MCDVCGCGDPEIVSVDLHERILTRNDSAAAHNRAHFEREGCLAINLMGSPGAGKTALLEATRRVAPELRLTALNGDLATDHDAARLEAAGIPAATITTGTACHLDAPMVHHALHHFGEHGHHSHDASHASSASHGPHASDAQDAIPAAAGDVPSSKEILFVENVGNLVCPAIYDLGQHANVVALSLTEGVDKPQKYPVMFQAADLVLLTKADLLPHLPGVEVDAVREALACVAPEVPLIVVSAISGEGMQEWAAWLSDQATSAFPQPNTPQPSTAAVAAR